MGVGMIRDISLDEPEQTFEKDALNLPSFKEGLEASLSTGKSVHVDGTNVVRVPFGVRQPRKQRPERPQRMATLVLPFQPLGSPTPPPQAA